MLCCGYTKQEDSYLRILTLFADGEAVVTMYAHVNFNLTVYILICSEG